MLVGFSVCGRRVHAASPLALVILLLLATLASASVKEAPLSYSMRLWQTDDGLPQNSVFAVTQTPDGYLWVGTHNGVARFDGLRFTLIDDPEVPELAQAWITALVAATDETLWLGTDGYGLYRFNTGEWKRLRVSDGLPSNQILCLLEGAAGEIWIGTEGGLVRYDAGRLTTYTTEDGLGDNSIRALALSREQRLWVATKRGLSFSRQSSVERQMGTPPSSRSSVLFSTLTFPGGWNQNALRAVRQQRDGTLWAGSAGGLHRLGRPSETSAFGDTNAAAEIWMTVNGLPDNVVNCLFEDPSGQLWVGTYGGLARVAADGKLTPRTGAGGPFGDMVNTVFSDRENNLWVGCRDGLYRLTPARFKTFGTEQGLSGNNVVSVREDNLCAGMWVGIWGGGVNFLEPSSPLADGTEATPGVPKVTVYHDRNMLRDSVLALCQTSKGDLWMGMDFASGLSCLRASSNQLPTGSQKAYQRTPFPMQASLIGAPIRVVHADRQGSLWVGTRGGLNRLTKQTADPDAEQWSIETYGTTNGLAANSIQAICEGPDGTIWIGTEGGLSRWKGRGKGISAFESFTPVDGLPRSTVTALYRAADKSLWIGTRGSGLHRLRQSKVTHYTTREGMFSDEIYEILEDDFGYFWMSCRRGIFRVAKRDFDEYDQGQRRNIACTAFGKSDGLVSVQCNGVAKPGGWKARDGRLWFPTIRGVVCVEARLPTNEQPPPVAIEEVRVDTTLLAQANAAQPLRVPPGRGELEIRYTALSLQAPEKNRFKYKLEGADSAWVDAGTERVARYNKLAPGTYRFRVIACNNDGLWNETGAVIALVFGSYYWQTWWFKTTVAALAGLLIGLAYRLRIARLREIERLRVEIAANLHDDVGARLTKVAMITEQVEQQTLPADRLKTQLHTVAQTTQEIIQAMDEIVWTINPRNDTLDHLASYLFQFAEDYFQDTNVRCRLHLPAQLPDQPISTKVRHNVFMAIKEALNNILKHSGATEVQITLRVEGPAILFTVADNGRGFDLQQRRSSGEGLRNMEQRLEQIGGRLLLRTAPGTGTTIELKVVV